MIRERLNRGRRPWTSPWSCPSIVATATAIVTLSYAIANDQYQQNRATVLPPATPPMAAGVQNPRSSRLRDELEPEPEPDSLELKGVGVG